MVAGFSFGATMHVFGGAFVGGFAAFAEPFSSVAWRGGEGFSGSRQDRRLSGWREK
jgi:hypothetical protein